MPELPEVETYRRFLDELVVGEQIVAFVVLDQKVLATDEELVRQGVHQRRITHTSRLGKNCFLHLDSGAVLVLHFGMTGDVGAYRHEADRPRFTRAVLELSSGLCIAFVDARKFGRIRLADSAAQYQQSRRLGPDALTISLPELTARLHGRRTMLKPLLLDQQRLAGLGNWLVDEILYQAYLHPERLAGTLSEQELERLHTAIQFVLETAITAEARYSAMPAGMIIHAREWDESPTNITNHHLHCPRHPQVAIDKTYVGGRATYTCPVCQPAP